MWLLSSVATKFSGYSHVTTQSCDTQSSGCTVMWLHSCDTVKWLHCHVTTVKCGYKVQWLQSCDYTVWHSQVAVQPCDYTVMTLNQVAALSCDYSQVWLQSSVAIVMWLHSQVATQQVSIQSGGYTIMWQHSQVITQQIRTQSCDYTIIWLHSQVTTQSCDYTQSSDCIQSSGYTVTTCTVFTILNFHLPGLKFWT